MLTLLRCRQLLGAAGDELTDAQVEKVCDEMYAVAQSVFSPAGARHCGNTAGPALAWRLVSGGRREALEERAAILEFDAGLSRDMAERAAFAQLCRRGAEN
jgi:hypothetical protein